MTYTILIYCQRLYKEGELFHNDIKPANLVLQKMDHSEYEYKYKFIDLGGACLVKDSKEHYAD